MKVLWISLLMFIGLPTIAQNVESFGVFGGFTIPFTIDQGLNKDLRFYPKFTLRGSPVGFSYGYDHVGYGFLVTPQFIRTGQKFIIQNTVGGEVGVRDIEMNFLSVPFALKLHIADMAFFRFSAVAAINAQYLVKRNETITHIPSKLKYPPTVIVPDEPGYVQEYDGVFVPDVGHQVYVSNDKFKPLQIFAAVGFHSDYEINDNWSINFDGRANFGIFDPRRKSYTDQLKQSGFVPDLYGSRREIYLSGTIGVSRIFQIKQTFKNSKSGKLVGDKFFPTEKKKKKK